MNLGWSPHFKQRGEISFWRSCFSMAAEDAKATPANKLIFAKVPVIGLHPTQGQIRKTAN
jgi:hypothetical protein